MIHNTILQLALKLPGENIIDNPVINKDVQITNLAGLITPILNIMFYVAVFLAFYYLVWGAIQYIMAQGKKEDLAKARARITWALIGLIIIFLSFTIAKYAAEIFKPGIGGLPF